MAIVDYLKALADDTRLKIVRLLLKGEKNVTDIVLHVKKSQPNTSLALKLLMHAGIVEQKKDGRTIYYSLVDKRKIRRILRLLENEN